MLDTGCRGARTHCPAAAFAAYPCGATSPVVGDTVALHWDWVCDVLTLDQADQADRIFRLEVEQRTAVGLGASG